VQITCHKRSVWSMAASWKSRSCAHHRSALALLFFFWLCLCGIACSSPPAIMRQNLMWYIRFTNSRARQAFYGVQGSPPCSPMLRRGVNWVLPPWYPAHRSVLKGQASSCFWPDGGPAANSRKGVITCLRAFAFCNGRATVLQLCTLAWQTADLSMNTELLMYGSNKPCD